MNNISKKQNEDDIIRMLQAQSRAYTEAKNRQIIQYILIGLAMIMPVFAFFDFGVSTEEKEAAKSLLKNILSIYGIVALLFVENMERLQKKCTLEAATIQEQIDTELFKLKWNDEITGKKIPKERIIALSQKYKGKSMADWYENISPELDKNTATIMCQKINIWWNAQDNKSWGKLIYLITVLYYIVVFIAGLVVDMSLWDFTLTVFVPTLALARFTQKFINNQQDFAVSSKSLHAKVQTIIDKIESDNINPSDTEIRKIQNEIFKQRKRNDKVPDWYYKKQKKKREKIINATTLTTTKRVMKSEI